MKSKFVKISKNHNLPKWVLFSTAGEAWLQTLQILETNEDQIGWGIFYAKPWVIAFCLELYIKSVAAHKDNLFDGKKYSHKMVRILEDYRGEIPIFKKIYNNAQLMLLIGEYEKTIDTKFGETYVQINGTEQNMLIELIHELRNKVLKNK